MPRLLQICVEPRRRDPTEAHSPVAGRPLRAPPTASQATSAHKVPLPHCLFLSSSEQHEAGKSSPDIEFLASLELCTRMQWHRERVLVPGLPSNPLLFPPGSGGMKALTWGRRIPSSVSKQTPCKQLPLGHSRNWQHGLSRKDRPEKGLMWPQVLGKYSRREDVGLSHESAASGPGFLLPGSKGSAY